MSQFDTAECHCTHAHWGPECDQACPVSDVHDTAVCAAHGTCRKTDGSCLCQARWANANHDVMDYYTGYIDSQQVTYIRLIVLDQGNEDTGTQIHL